jgi:hypothetical protein
MEEEKKTVKYTGWIEPLGRSNIFFEGKENH